MEGRLTRDDVRTHDRVHTTVPASRTSAEEDGGGAAPAAGRVERPPIWPVLALVGTGLALLAFVAASAYHPIHFGIFKLPPLYGYWRPVARPPAALALAAAVLLGGVTALVTSGRRLPTWLALALLVGLGVVTAVAVALVRGPHELTRGVATGPHSPYYTSDLHFVEEYGIRGFTRRYPQLSHLFHTYNSRTHPPGVLVLLYVLFRLLGAAHTLRITTALAVFAMAAAVCAYAMGRSLGGERSGRIAAALLVAAPGPLMLAYTNLDVVFATVLTTAAAVFMVAIHRRSAALAAAGGAVLAAGTYLTYATVFVAAAVVVAVLIRASLPGEVARLLGGAGLAGLAVLALLRLALGFDVLAAFRAVPAVTKPYDPYWIVASPAAWLIMAGLPIAALGVAGLVHRVPGARRPVLAAALVLIMLLWAVLPTRLTHLRPGEVERTWAFLYPVLAACAGPVVDRWTLGRPRLSGAVVGLLVALSVVQAVILESMWENLF